MKRLKRICLIVLIVFLVYSLSYIVLSRWSLSIAKEQGAKGFYYIPVSLETLENNNALWQCHIILKNIYYPVWWTDQHLLDGPAVGGDFRKHQISAE